MHNVTLLALAKTKVLWGAIAGSLFGPLAVTVIMATLFAAKGLAFYQRVSEKDHQQDDRMGYIQDDLNRRFREQDDDRKERRLDFEAKVNKLDSRVDRQETRLEEIEGNIKYLWGGGTIGFAVLGVMLKLSGEKRLTSLGNLRRERDDDE